MASEEFTFSEQIYRIWGLPQNADLASLRMQPINPDDLFRVMQDWHAALAAGGEHAIAYRIVRPDGVTRYLSVAIEVALNAAGDAASLHGTHHDITDLTLAQQAAVKAGTLFDAILTATPDYTFVTDLPSSAVIYGSPGKTILGMTAEELAALGPSVIGSLVHPDEQPRLLAANAADLDDGEILQIRYRARHADGSWHWLHRRVTPFRRDEATGEVIEVLGVVRDVTDVVDVVDAQDRLAHATLHDSLTGLPNRALLMDRLEAALARAAQTKRDVAILFCDLDGFKHVNDTAGHAAGDAVLIEIAARLKAVLREHDTIARVGGDEFVIVIEPWKRTGATPRPKAPARDGAARARNDRARGQPRRPYRRGGTTTDHRQPGRACRHRQHRHQLCGSHPNLSVRAGHS